MNKRNIVAAKYRASMGQVRDEVEQLQEKGFISNTLGVEQIRTDLHLNSCWADAYWRRRDRHSTRSDPEISFLNEENRTRTSDTNYTALEIGSAYGRVTAKLAQRDRFDTITGIEIGTDFETYCNMYQKIQNYNRERVNFIFDNFFTSNELQSGSYDLILLPMNTFPSFGIDKLPILLKRVSDLL